MVALYKTGTLTAGKPVMTDLEVAEVDRAQVLSLVAAVEAQSEHPVAAAIVAAAEAEGLVLDAVGGFEAIPGFDVNATVDGLRIAVGADRHMAQLGIDVQAFAKARAVG